MSGNFSLMAENFMYKLIFIKKYWKDEIIIYTLMTNVNKY